MESTLHRQLKHRLGDQLGGRMESRVAGYRVDVVGEDHGLIEIQTGALGPLRDKLGALLPSYRVRVVKPVELKRWIVWRADGQEGPARRSPWCGRMFDLFDDFLGLAPLFPNPNLRIDVLGVEIEEVRVARPRRAGYRVLDRRLRRVIETIPLVRASDLWSLVPPGLPHPFTTRDLATRLPCRLDVAQRIAYCLRRTGAVRQIGKRGAFRLYEDRSAMAELGNGSR